MIGFSRKCLGVPFAFFQFKVHIKISWCRQWHAIKNSRYNREKDHFAGLNSAWILSLCNRRDRSVAMSLLWGKPQSFNSGIAGNRSLFIGHIAFDKSQVTSFVIELMGWLNGLLEAEIVPEVEILTNLKSFKCVKNYGSICNSFILFPVGQDVVYNLLNRIPSFC